MGKREVSGTVYSEVYTTTHQVIQAREGSFLPARQDAAVGMMGEEEVDERRRESVPDSESSVSELLSTRSSTSIGFERGSGTRGEGGGGRYAARQGIERIGGSLGRWAGTMVV